MQQKNPEVGQGISVVKVGISDGVIYVPREKITHPTNDSGNQETMNRPPRNLLVFLRIAVNFS